MLPWGNGRIFLAGCDGFTNSGHRLLAYSPGWWGWVEVGVWSAGKEITFWECSEREDRVGRQVALPLSYKIPNSTAQFNIS